ncbi:MAG: hypothetical protein Q9P01_21825 [Anaerolineae bacterium]|nr:hypothetical protein [Anaerolineae bacterium]
MPIFIEWYDAEQSIIIGHITTGWTWDAAQQGRVAIQALAQSVSYPVALAVQLPPDISVPPNGFAENSKDSLQYHANLGLHTVVYITTNPAIIALWLSVIEVYANPAVQYHFSPSLEAAVRMLADT